MAGRARLFAGAKWEREGRWAGREGGGRRCSGVGEENADTFR